MTNYQIGFRFEHEVAQYYTKRGYLVIRAAGSHTPFDLLCLPLGEHLENNVLVMQLKRYTKYAAKPDDAFGLIPLPPNVTKIWITKRKGEKYNPEICNKIIP